MAEAIFDIRHPLEAYLSESLQENKRVTLPGGMNEILDDPPIEQQHHHWRDDLLKRLARHAINVMAIIVSILTSLHIIPPTHTSLKPRSRHIKLAKQFAERFKYVLVSSSLFETSLSPNTALPDISRFPSPHDNQEGDPFHYAFDDRLLEFSSAGASDRAPRALFVQSWIYQFFTPRNTTILTLAFSLYINGYTLLFSLALLAIRLPNLNSSVSEELARTEAMENERLEIAQRSYTMTLEALDTLILAGNVWNSVVNEAMSILELDERRIFYGPSSSMSHSPVTSTSLRVALSSMLQTTQSQTDNVRQLFSPLTSGKQLSQLSEMYAPSTPLLPKGFSSSQHTKSSSVHSFGNRPLSLSITTPNSRLRHIEIEGKETSKADKRSTWSAGSTDRRHSLTGMPPMGLASQFQARKAQRRSNLSNVMRPDEDEEPNTSGVGLGFAGLYDTSPLTKSVPPSPGQTIELAPDASRTDGLMPTPTITIPIPPTPSPTSTNSTQFPSPSPSRSPKSPSNGELSLSHSRSNGSLAAGSPSSPTPSPSRRPRTSPTSSAGSPSRFTLLQTTRHPLSLSSLQNSIQVAIGSKRYAAAHLLALRFGDSEDEREAEEDDWEDSASKRLNYALGGSRRQSRGTNYSGHSRRTSYDSNYVLDGFVGDDSFTSQEDEWELDTEYWEDIRSVIALLTTALEDAAERLVDAIEESDRERMRDSYLSPLPPLQTSKDSEQPSSMAMTLGDSLSRTVIPPRRTTQAFFAPVSPPLTKFATHIHAVAAALDEAREQLASCMMHAGGDATSSTGSYDLALSSYDRLRKEIGVALRECERGRLPLMDVFRLQEDVEDDEDEEGVPALAHDQSSNEDQDSDPQDRAEGLLPVHRNLYLPSSDEPDAEPEVDVTRQHLMMTSNPAHLPAAGGPEQVFESEGADKGFDRPRSTMTREERIAMAKAKRQSLGSAQTTSPTQPSGERSRAISSPIGRGENAWGPGGEVVQELKTVIWRVGERRKKMAGEQETSPNGLVSPRVAAPSSPLEFAPSQPGSAVSLDDDMIGLAC